MSKNFYMVLPFAAALIKDKRGRILLGRHPNVSRKPYPGYWDLPSGKMESLETPEECIIREIKEETGFDTVSLKLIDVFHSYGNDPDCTNTVPGIGLCYELEVSGEFVPAEMEDMHWISTNELGKLQLVPWTQWFLREYLK